MKRLSKNDETLLMLNDIDRLRMNSNPYFRKEIHSPRRLTCFFVKKVEWKGEIGKLEGHIYILGLNIYSKIRLSNCHFKR